MALCPRSGYAILARLVLALWLLPHPSLAASEATAPVDQQNAARLRALGYIPFAEDEPSPNPKGNADGDGVWQLDPLAAAPGLTLVVTSTGCAARLLDRVGAERHRWTQARCRQWWGAALMRNGDLVVNGSLVAAPPPKESANPLPVAGKRSTRFVARIAWTGETRWILMMSSHHQLDLTPRGEILVLMEATVRGERINSLRDRLGDAANLTLHDNSLRWLSPDGAAIETLSLLDAVDSGEPDFPFADRQDLMEGAAHLGLFHCNSAYSMDQPHFLGRGPLHREGNVLVTSRNQNRIFIVNRESRKLVWQWGKDDLQAPHNATWLANGNLLVFDNGVLRKRSRVIELDPEARAIVWQYPPADPPPNRPQGPPGSAGSPALAVEFFTKSRGMAQRLDNGNTLIVESNAGRAFEITPANQVVWRYSAPLTDEGKRPVLITLRRYRDSWLEVALPESPVSQKSGLGEVGAVPSPDS